MIQKHTNSQLTGRFFFASTMRFVLLMVFLLQACTSSSEQWSRPEGSLLLDRAEILEDMNESLHRQLRSIRDRYGIEVVVATTAAIDEEDTINSLAARLFTRWDIGREFDGRGLLLLLADTNKEVRIEVGLALEGVFTDLFTGYIENKQLKSYYLSNQLATGLVAVLEEIEVRAELLSRGDATAELIETRDMDFLSAGGGADVDMKEYSKEAAGDAQGKYPAGETADEAWQTLLQSWRDKNRDPTIGVYTPVTRLIYRAFTSQPDRRFEEDVRTWGDKAYEVIGNDRYAVIFFGKEKGWDNAPFLFCRRTEGWQFDMVHQRKIVRMGRSPFWGIERGEHPYIKLLSRCPYWMGQDIPRWEEDVYDISRDEETARQIVALEEQLAADRQDFNVLYQLGRLYTLTSMGQQRFTLLTEAQTMQPDHPETLKYLAIAHVEAHYQYKTALDYINRYIDLQPGDAIGHFFRGYLLFMEKRYDEAASAFEDGLVFAPESVYGLAKLARCYQQRNRTGDRLRALEILDRLHRLAPGHLRVKWLQETLR